MILLKRIRNRHFYELIKLQNPNFNLTPISPKSFKFLFISSISSKSREKLTNLDAESSDSSNESGEKMKTLSLISRKPESIEQNRASVNLSALFADNKANMKQVKSVNKTTVYKELSPDMQTFAHHLYMRGYLKDANCLPKNKFDATCFGSSYGREFLKYAAVKFGGDHREIGRWLSASDLKRVALFGCPSLAERSIWAAKHMRKFFGVDEKKVCEKCTLRKSCKQKNKQCKRDATQLDLAKVARVLVIYAMESVPQQLVVPEEINNAVNRLLKEIVNLSRTTS